MKIIKLFALMALFTLLNIFSIYAGVWKKDTRGWWYDYGNGSYPIKKWEWIDSNNDNIAECYCFDDNGYCIINSKNKDGYQLNKNGAWVEKGKVQTKLIDSGYIDKDILRYIAFSLWDGNRAGDNGEEAELRQDFYLDFTKQDLGTETQRNILLRVGYFIVNDYISTGITKGDEGKIILDKHTYAKALKDLIGSAIGEKVWEKDYKVDSDPSKVILGIGDYGTDKPFSTLESVAPVENGYIIRGKVGFQFEIDNDYELVTKNYEMKVRINSDSYFGKFTVESISITGYQEQHSNKKFINDDLTDVN